MKEITLIQNSKKCEKCGKCFSKPALLRRHLVVHGKEKPYSCISCSSRFSQQSTLQRHMRIKHVDSDDSAEVAQQALAALKQLQASHNLVLSQAQITLEEQPAPCQMVQLRDQLHPNGELQLLSTQRIRRQQQNSCYYVCEYCAKEFSKSYDLIRHRRMHTKETPYPCNCCLKWFATQAKLTEHQKRVHVKLKRHACKVCNASYSRKSELHKHLTDEHQLCEAREQLKADPHIEKLMELLPQPIISQRSYKCIYCAKQFKRKFNCRCHMVTHLRRLLSMQPAAIDATRHSCLQCSKYFQKPSDLARHLLTHSQLRLHVCQLCPKRFSLKSTLSRHQQTHQHQQRNAINCQVCGKSFASKASLQLHLRLHTGEQPFSCEICAATFRTSGHRLEHMRAERHKSVASNALII